MTVPTIEPHHFVYAGRAGWRIGTWALRIGFWRPVLVTIVLWFASGVAYGWHVSTPVGSVNRTYSAVCERLSSGLVPSCILKTDGSGTQLPMPVAQTTDLTHPASAALHAAEVTATLGAVTFVIALATGFMTMVGAFKPSRYERRGTIRGAVRNDWNDAKSDARKAKKGMRQVGNIRARHYDRAGIDRSQATGLDARILKHADPAKQQKAKKPKGKKARQEADADWDTAVAEIAVARIARAEAVRPRLDPAAGPPLAPLPVGETRTESPEVAGWNQRAEAVRADTARYLAELQTAEHQANGWAGYTPPPAPISVKDDQ